MTDPGDPGDPEDPGDPGDPPPCAAADYGDMGAATGDAYGTVEDGFLGLDVTLNEEPDLLSVALYAEYGVFAAGITAGTFELTGAEADVEDCGACVSITTQDGETYQANAGTLILTSVSGRLTGSLGNVAVRHVAPDETTFEWADAADGCSGRIAGLRFDQELPPPEPPP
jgi:hypothetical protein